MRKADFPKALADFLSVYLPSQRNFSNPETPTIYPVEVGTEFEVRCYQVSVIEGAEGELDITVLGTIPTDE